MASRNVRKTSRILRKILQLLQSNLTRANSSRSGLELAPEGVRMHISLRNLRLCYRARGNGRRDYPSRSRTVKYEKYIDLNIKFKPFTK